MPSRLGLLLTRTLGPVAIAAVALGTALAGGAAAASLTSAEIVAAAAPAVPAPSPTDPLPTTAVTPVTPATCVPQPTAPQAGAGSSGGGTQVSFVVPATTLINVDVLGRPVSVSTNTGQAPCPTDVFLRVAPDGEATAAAPALSAAVRSLPYGADWAPGVPQDLPAG